MQQRAKPGRRRPTGVETMSPDDAWRFISGQSLGRLSIQLEGYPVAFPVNYLVEDQPSGRRIVFRTAPLAPLGRHRGPASLAVDLIDTASGRAWTAIVRGELGRLTGRRPSGDPRPFITEGRTQWMQLVATAVDGRRFRKPLLGTRATDDRATSAVSSAKGTSRTDQGDDLTHEGRTLADAFAEEAHRIRALIAPPGSTE